MKTESNTPQTNSRPSPYTPSEIEPKWQAQWQEKKLYQPDLETANRPFYNLHMFPYPSAEGLHVGNVYAFTGADIYGRFKRMQGFDVFQPFGLDGFGIHSENYALKVGTHPMDQAQKSEKRFYSQVQSLGSGYDWEHILETYDQDYYQWTQWLFTELFKSGLAYRKKLPVNFCPSCKTVLADEQVVDDGHCERCGSVVEKRDLEQWLFRITEYAEELLQGLDKIDWTEKVKIAQRNWIGKSEGALINFRVADTEIELSVFTTRPDTLYGATFLVLSPEHPVVKEWLANPQVAEYVAEAKKKPERERRENKDKTGVFTGYYALNPVNNQQIPIWIADYVLMGYGTGAIMSVPAHDQRDYEFARKYELAIKEVIAPETGISKPDEESRDVGCGVIFDPETQRYAVAKSKDGIIRLFAGGVDDSEDLEKGVLREITEESGLYDFVKVERITTSFSHFYNRRKKLNRSALAACYLVVLGSRNQQERKLEAHELDLNLAWVSAPEIQENWIANNKDGGLDHWITFLRESVGRAIELGYDTTSDKEAFKREAYTGRGMIINSGEWDGLKMPEDKEKVLAYLEEKGIAKRHITYHLRDWLISRQRYWGPPIPMIYCQTCAQQGKSWFTTKKEKDKDSSTTWDSAGWYPEETLPVKLPRIEDYQPLGTGNSPLGNHPEFYQTTCPECGSKARRETDVSDTFLDSSWYFLRYLATDLYSLPFPLENRDKFQASEEEKAKAAKRTQWLPVTVYTGGAEHSVLHLLYTRFFYKFLVDSGYIDSKKGDEPFPKFYAHGLIIKDGAKMSKSKGNVVVPDEYITKYGADTLRSYLMFLGPFNQGGDFRDSGIEGMYKFIKRVWVLLSGQSKPSTTQDSTATTAINEAIKGVTEDIEAFRYNTALAKIMTLYNHLAKKKEINREEAKVLLQLLSPFAPHMTEELWEKLGESVSIHTSPWPTYDPEALKKDVVTIAIQINGKLRDTITIPSGQVSEKEGVEKLAHENEKIAKYLTDKTVKQVIYVPGKILNFVIA